MSNRIDKERVKELQPQRMEYAISQIVQLGYEILFQNQTRLEFEHIGERVRVFPFSGWFSGKSIKDGRGIAKLVEQLKK